MKVTSRATTYGAASVTWAELVRYAVARARSRSSPRSSSSSCAGDRSRGQAEAAAAAKGPFLAHRYHQSRRTPPALTESQSTAHRRREGKMTMAEKSVAGVHRRKEIASRPKRVARAYRA